MMEGLFNFEQDGRYALRRIPMIMRFNLDACGIRVSLSTWNVLCHEEREMLIALPCSSPSERHAYHQRMIAMLNVHTSNPDVAIESVDIEEMPAWQQLSIIPQQVIDRMAELSLPVPTLEQWQFLGDLQRFALIKLTRSGHKNDNLLPALKEFELA